MDNKKIKDAIDKLNKNFGNGTVVTFSKDDIKPIERIPSGSLGLDYALGGGWPRGRMVSITGWESSGKTTLAIHAAAEVHKMGGVVAYIDMENSFDSEYATNLGVEVDNPNKWLFSQPDNGDQAIEIAKELIETGEVDLLVIDSVAALVPKAEIEGDIGDAKMGLQARLMSKAMRVMVGKVNETNTVVMFLNQWREKIGVMFGPTEVEPGGNALKFYASVRCDIRRIGQNKDGDQQIVSNKTRVKVIKNKTAIPFGQSEFDIVFGKGVCVAGEIVDMGVGLDIIKKSGSWHSYQDTKLANGREATISILEDNPELMDELKEKILKQLQ